MSDTSATELHLVAPRRSVRKHLHDVWRYRELWLQLVRKELHVRYQKSVLGLAWSLANPLFLLMIYTVVFSILGSSFESFAIWILCGLLLWNFFATSLSTGTQAITGNAYLVGKVNFPREILPLAAVGAAFVHFLISSGLMVVVLAVLRFKVAWGYVWLVIPAVLTCLVMAAAFAILLSAVNVYARDTTHLLDLAILAWFWLTPIIYTFQLVTDRLENRGWYGYLHLLNPMTPLIITMQRAIYGRAWVETTVNGKPARLHLLPDLSSLWYLRNIGFVAVFAAVLLVVAIKVFDRAEANFAEVM